MIMYSGLLRSSLPLQEIRKSSDHRMLSRSFPEGSYKRYRRPKFLSHERPYNNSRAGHLPLIGRASEAEGTRDDGTIFRWF